MKTGVDLDRQDDKDRDVEAEFIGRYLAMAWRSVPSLHVVFADSPGRKRSVIVTDGDNPILIASDLEPEVADLVCKVHNAALRGTP